MLKQSIGGVQTASDEIICKFGNDYLYEELDVYGKIPNVDVTDKMLVYTFDGLIVMFFESTKHDKLFMYSWQVYDDKYLRDTNLFIGFPFKKFRQIFGISHNPRDSIESYDVGDGDLYFIFSNDNLEKVYWKFSDG